MKKWIILLFLTIACLHGEVINLQKENIVAVHDGDTFKVNLPNCYIATACSNLLVRVAHIDTPELHGTSAREKDLAKQATAITLKFFKTTGTYNMDCGRDKYYRLNCSVSKNGVDLASTLIEAKLAVPYEGKKKIIDWSK